MTSVSRRVQRALRRAALGVAAAVVSAIACDRTVSPTEALPPLAAASVDADAGTWRMIVLGSPDQIAVAAPAAVTSDAYAAEVETLKGNQGRLTDAQRREIE